MGRRRGRTGPGGAVVSSLSENSGGTISTRNGPNSVQSNKRRGKKDDTDEELNRLADLPSKRKNGKPPSSSNTASSSSQAGSSSSTWLGKSPQQMLREWCSKNTRKWPSYVIFCL